MRRAANLDGNHGEIVEALLSVVGVSVHSLAGLGCGVPDLLVGARERTYLVVVLLDAGKALSWARSIAAAPSTYVDLFGREEDLNRCHA